MSFHDRLQAVVEIGDVLLFVMQGDDDGVLWHDLLIIDEKFYSLPATQWSKGYLRVGFQEQ